jgi:hypothetical protein
MSNLGNYSPFNKSYQFIHLQNSAYHHRNKQRAKPVVKTNIRPTNRSLSTHRNSKSRSDVKSSARYSLTNSQMIADPISESYTFKEPKRFIHKHQSYERVRSAKIDN